MFSGVGSFFSGIFGGGLATGGPVTAGTSYLVGERGPELFTPSASGFITPNGGSGGITQHITVDARGADRGVEARIRQAMLIAKDQAKAELIQEVESGGRIARVFGR
jgi:phage-related minor tail protein